MQKWIINVVPCPASTATPPYSEYSKTSLVWGHCMQVYSCAGILHQQVKGLYNQVHPFNSQSAMSFAHAGHVFDCLLLSIHEFDPFFLPAYISIQFLSTSYNSV